MRYLMPLLAPLLLLAGCATTTQQVRYTPPDVGVSSYGLFLAGQGALNDGSGARAAQYFEDAQRLGDPDGSIAEHAFSAAILAGDVGKAAVLLKADDPSTTGGSHLGRLVQGVAAMADGKGKLAHRYLSEGGSMVPHTAVVALLSPWAAAMAGDAEGAIVRPQAGNDRIVEYFGMLGQAALFESARRFDEAETDFKALTAGDRPASISLLAYGNFLERRGRRLDAVALYGRGLALDPRDRALKDAKKRAATGGKAPQLSSLKSGAAQAIMAPAATLLAGKQQQMSLVYLRLALWLDPDLDTAWLMVGDVMTSAGGLEAARTAYGKVKPGSNSYTAAQTKLVWSYQTAKDTVTAIALARQAATGGDPEALITLADLLRVNGQYAESAELLTRVIKDQPDWRLLYARGATYQQAGLWPQAEQDLTAALKAQPDDPEVLNYLGYSWIDRGENLDKALAMVQRAVASNPQSGAMIDSLGWAYYRLGNFKLAVEYLERAIDIEAGDPDINNHLGDAYWRVGRRDEAIFQWRRVLTLDPDAKLKAEAEAKLAAGGLGPAGPVAVPKVAGQ